MTTDISNPVKIAKDGRVMSPNSLANLKPYLPGTNGHGRVYSLANRLKHALDHPLTEPKVDAPVGEHIVYATLKGAIDLVPVAFRETWDRTEGKVLDKTAVVGDILIEVVFRDINSGKASDNNPSGTPYPALPPG